MQKTVDVHIGEVKIARGGELLKAILGSCVGIGVIWKERHLCGLAHCLLPEGPSPTFTIGGRFADQAFRSLIAMMKIKPQDVDKIDVIIVGGGNMTRPGSADIAELVGANNVKVAMREAKKYGLHVSHLDAGGEEGRKIFVDASTCTYRVEKIPRIIETV